MPADTVAVIGRQVPEAMEVLLAQTVRADAAVAREDSEFAVLGRQIAVGGQLLELQGLGGVYTEIFLPLHGEHQAHNAVVALAAVEAFFGAGAQRQLDIDAVRAGFAAVTSPGRLERMRSAPTVFIDAAHNPAGAAALAQALAEEFDFRFLVGVVSVMADKDVDGILAALEPVFDQIVVTHNGSPRALDVESAGAARRGAIRPGAGDHRRRPARCDRDRDRARRGGRTTTARASSGSGHRHHRFGRHRRRGPHAVRTGNPNDRAAHTPPARPVEELPRRDGGHADPGGDRRAARAAGGRAVGGGLTAVSGGYLIGLAVVLVLLAGHPGQAVGDLGRTRRCRWW